MRYFSVICILLASISGAVAADMTHEEAIVRNTYAKLSYAVDLNTVYKIVQTNPKVDAGDLARQVELGGLRFQLSNFKVGNLADVAEASYADVTGQYPDGQDVIHVTLATHNRSEGDVPTVSSETASAKWGPGPGAAAINMTVKQMLPVMEQESGISPLRRYCSFTVTATLAGRSRTYKASFLFGGKDQVATGDVVVALGGGALRHFVSHPVYPNLFLRTSLWNNPAVHDFLVSNQRVESSCKPGRGDACCDGASLRCGVPSADLIGREQ